MNMGLSEFYNLQITEFKNKYKGYFTAKRDQLDHQWFCTVWSTVLIVNSSGNVKRPLNVNKFLPDRLKQSRRSKITKEERQKRIDFANSIKWK